MDRAHIRRMMLMMHIGSEINGSLRVIYIFKCKSPLRLYRWKYSLTSKFGNSWQKFQTQWMNVDPGLVVRSSAMELLWKQHISINMPYGGEWKIIIVTYMPLMKATLDFFLNWTHMECPSLSVVHHQSRCTLSNRHAKWFQSFWLFCPSIVFFFSLVCWLGAKRLGVLA
jgi:hypothetical protein